MKILVIWLAFSVPLGLAVMRSIRAAMMPIEVVELREISVNDAEPVFSSLNDVDENLPTQLVQFTWFDAPADNAQGIQPANTSGWSEQIKIASGQLLNINKVARILVQYSAQIDDPATGQAKLTEFVAGSSPEPDLVEFFKRPDAVPIQQAVAHHVKQKLTQLQHEAWRNEADPYYKPTVKPNKTACDAIIAALKNIPEELRTTDDREKIRWAQFWKHWLPVSALASGSNLSLDRLEKRWKELQKPFDDDGESEFPSVSENEVREIQTIKDKMAQLTIEIDIAKLKTSILQDPPSVWLEPAEKLFENLDLSEGREQLAMLIRDKLTQRISDVETPGNQHQEAVTKNDEVLIGDFDFKDELNGRRNPNPFYVFESATGGYREKNLYPVSLAQEPQETFAVRAHKKISRARKQVIRSPHDRASWGALQTLVTDLEEQKERYLNLKFVAGNADLNTVTDQLDALKLDETRIVCSDLMRDADTWARVLQLIAPQR